jgi:UTP:GlnB (protein PII) uridylyltransferase
MKRGLSVAQDRPEGQRPAQQAAQHDARRDDQHEGQHHRLWKSPAEAGESRATPPRQARHLRSAVDTPTRPVDAAGPAVL